MSLGWLGGHHNKQNANYPISDKTLEQEPPFLPASMNNSNMTHPKWGFACSARGSGSSPVIQGHEAHEEWDVIRDLWHVMLLEHCRADQLGSGWRVIPTLPAAVWSGTLGRNTFIRSLCLCPGGTGMSPAPGRSCSQHLGALLKVRAALVLPFQHPTCP